MRPLLGLEVCPVASAQELESLSSSPSPFLNPRTFTAPLQGTIRTLGCGIPLQNLSIVRSRSQKANALSFGCQATIQRVKFRIFHRICHRIGQAMPILVRCYTHTAKISPNMSPNTSPNTSLKPVLKKIQQNKNKLTDKGIYRLCRKNKSWEKSTACINPQMVWRETRSPPGSGNEVMHDPKSQQHDKDSLKNRKRNRIYKRSEISTTQRKANRATQQDTYSVAQECPSVENTRNSIY